jgi:hypothetical protein
MAIKIIGSTIIDDSRNIVNAGIVTATSVAIGTAQVVSSGQELQNILSLDNVTTETIESVSGVRISENGNIVGYANTVDFSGVGVNVTPVSSGLSTVTIDGFPQVTNILYVTKNGDDSNDGRTLGNAKATIKGAVADSAEGTVIKVSAGTYIEDNPITLPNQISVVGDSLREVTITPANQGDLFYVGEGNYVAEMSFVGAPNPGSIFSFDPKVVRYNAQSPYIQNCTNFIPDSIGLKVDGKFSIGPTKSMVLDSYTQYNQGGIGVSITNEGYAQLVSLFTICNEVAVYCGSGGACDLTNSNSSFGDFGLISDGVSPLKFSGFVFEDSEANTNVFTIDLNTPTLGVVTALYDNHSGIVTITTDQPHKFNIGMGVSIVGLAFTCPSGPETLIYPTGNYGYKFEVKTVAPARYVDASNSIRANKTEIQDKSLAAIAISHPDFYFPGDPQTTEYSRFYDSYRLIQQNKQEIVDKSLASIAVGFPTGFSFPDDPVPYEQNRYYDAYRLIILNKDEIVGTAFTNTVNEPTFIGFDFASVQEKCKRDLGFFVDAIATDVFIGGNTYARAFSLQYFDENGNPIADGLLGEESESIYAFEQARDLMKQAITNQLSYQEPDIFTGPAEFGGTGGDLDYDDPNACSDVQQTINTLSAIVTTTIGAGNTSSLPTQNLGISTTNKCARDLGYFVDAVSTDIFTGGNSYSIAFTKFYFDKNGNPISNGLLGEESESVFAFVSARELAKKAITNQLNVKDLTLTPDPITGSNIDPDSCANVQSAIDTLVGITTQAISSGSLIVLNSINVNPGIFITGQNKCRRDIGYIVDAIADDLEGFTNKNIIAATKAYFDINGNPISNGLVGEVAESITAFHAIRDYSKKAINNLLNAQDLTLQVDPLTGSNQDENSCADVKSTIDNLVGILTTYVGLGTLTGLPSISLPSDTFSANVGASTLPHTYVGGGNVNVNVVRPFDGQVVYFGDLYYSVGRVIVSAGGTGYLGPVDVILEEPETEWGIPATAVAEASNGSLTNIEMISNGRGYRTPPKVTVLSPDVGINTATAFAEMIPTYYVISSCTPISSGICTITVSDNVPYIVPSNTEVPFFKQSRLLASGHSLEYIGSGTEISKALPSTGGVAIQDNETTMKNGGLVVFTSTDQSGNFRIGDGVVINQQTGTISGTFYSKSLFSTMTPFILALGG